MCRFNDDGRVIQINEPGGGRPGRFSLSRTAAGNVWSFRDDVEAPVAKALARLCANEPALAAGTGDATAPGRLTEAERAPDCLADVHAALGESEPAAYSAGGPAYFWTGGHGMTFAQEIVDVTATNAHVFDGSMEDWLPDVGMRDVLKAVLVDGKAVAVCASVRSSPGVHEPGVETHPAHRRQGHALAVVDAWARAVAQLGAVPCYSTSWNNVASQRTAARLGFEFYAADWGVK